MKKNRAHEIRINNVYIFFHLVKKELTDAEISELECFTVSLFCAITERLLENLWSFNCLLGKSFSPPHIPLIVSFLMS